MTAERPDDDPTHALDDFVRRMRSNPAPPAGRETDLNSLDGVPQAGHGKPSDSGAAGRGTPRTGRRWQAGDIEDAVDISSLRQHTRPPVDTGRPDVQLPTVDLVAETSQASVLPGIALPAVDMPKPTDLRALDRSMRQAGHQAAEQWQTDADAAAAPVWQPDAQSLQLRPAIDPRLPAHWVSGAWVGVLRQVLDSRTEFVSTVGQAAPVVETYAPLLLLLLWPPQRTGQPLPDRWPQQVRLSALPRDQAVQALLSAVPNAAPLWLMDQIEQVEQVDWALAAEIALHHQAALRPFQIDGLREFIAAEREVSFSRVNAAYAASTEAASHGAIVRR